MAIKPSDAQISRRGRNEDFGRRLLELYIGAALSSIIVIGHQTGLFEAAATAPATSEELAERAQLEERYVREWLGAMASGGVMSYDPSTGRYTLPPDHARFLTGNTIRNVAPQSQMSPLTATILPDLIACFRHGGGVPYEQFRPGFTQVMDDNWRRIYDDQLIGGFLPVVKGLSERLLANNLANPYAPLYYSLSTLHCLTVSLAEGGAGLGAMWGEETARGMLADAGLRVIAVVDSPRPQNAISSVVRQRRNGRPREERFA